MSEKTPLELYFHIPFCARKCLYCDFLSAPGEAYVIARYLEALCREVRGKIQNGAVSCSSAPQKRPVTSVFIGGGTPSLLSGQQIKQLMETVRECCLLAEDAEITIEANPGTVDYEKLSAYRAAGINRLSIGLQSADDRELKALGRIHSYAEFLETYENARRAGFSNINVDVMSALPGQTLASCLETLQRVLSLSPPPEHISAYSLIVEEETPFWEMAENGSLNLPDEETERLMYWETRRILQENGYYRYEISNYAKAGFDCRHNCGYWRRTDYLGFGIGAASLFENVRFSNTRDLQEYLEHPLDCRQEVQILSVKEQMEEFMFLGLRMMEGVSPRIFFEKFGISLEEIYGPVIEKNISDGLLRCLEETPERPGQEEMPRQRKANEAPYAGEKRLALTERGIDLSNYCMAQFLLS